jgi:hypothetical protein
MCFSLDYLSCIGYINYMSTAEFNKMNDVRRERMLRELMSDLVSMVEAGDLTSEQANEWYNMKADQWAQGLS